MLLTALDHLSLAVVVECGMTMKCTHLLAEAVGRALISFEHDEYMYSQVRGVCAYSPRLFARWLPLGTSINAQTELRTATAQQIQTVDTTYRSVSRQLSCWGDFDMLVVGTLSAARLSALRELHTRARTIIIRDTEPPEFVRYGYDRFVREYGSEYIHYSYRPDGDWLWTDMFVAGEVDEDLWTESLDRHTRNYFGRRTHFIFVRCG